MEGLARALTLNDGLRWEFDPSPVNDNQVYTRTGPEGVFGVSGFGNLFKPGVYDGQLTQYRLLEKGEKAIRTATRTSRRDRLRLAAEFECGLLGRVFGDSGRRCCAAATR